jgi:type III secretion protein Q
VAAPYPWRSVPRIDRRAARSLSQVQAWLAEASAGSVMVRRGGVVVAELVEMGITGARVLGASTLAAGDLEARFADPTAACVRVRAGRVGGFAVVPGLLVRAIAQRLLGGPDEVVAPRPVTGAERAVLVVAVAAALDAAGVPGVEVDPSPVEAREVPVEASGEAVVVDVEIHGPVTARAAIVLSPDAVMAVPPRGDLAEALARRPAWADLTALALPLVVARARFGARHVAGLRPRDVVVAARVGRAGEADLVVARGRMRVGLALASGRVTVLTGYSRYPMDEMLADDASVDVAVAVGDVRLSVRALLELRPGQVLELGRPLGSGVELRVGPRVVARGELVDVDGDVGVRVLSIEDPSSP